MKKKLHTDFVWAATANRNLKFGVSVWEQHFFSIFTIKVTNFVICLEGQITSGVRNVYARPEGC
jgi:hypothetical protein